MIKVDQDRGDDLRDIGQLRLLHLFESAVGGVGIECIAKDRDPSVTIDHHIDIRVKADRIFSFAGNGMIAIVIQVGDEQPAAPRRHFSADAHFPLISLLPEHRNVLVRQHDQIEATIEIKVD